MKNDIETRADIDRLMVNFYRKAMADKMIGYFFTEVVKLDLDHHLPIIGDFWETLLFGSGSYPKHGRNPLRVHGEIHKKSPLNANHFKRWLEIFGESINESFEGERADFIKLRAGTIGNRMLEFVLSQPDQ